MNAKDLLIALFVPLSWGLGFVAAKSGLDHFPPLLIMSLRFFLSSILLVWFFPIPRGFLIQIFYIAFVSASLQYGLTFSGLNILAHSAINFTPQNTIMFASVSAAFRDRSKESPIKSAMSCISGA